MSSSKHLKEIIALLRNQSGDDATKAMEALGMMYPVQSTDGSEQRGDALEVLNKRAYAKAELDSVTCHTFPTIAVTGDILFSAQKFADDNTIPCTEWPTAEDIIKNVLATAMKYVVSGHTP